MSSTETAYAAICQRVWAMYQQTTSRPMMAGGTRNILFPPPPRGRPVDLLIVGISPNQSAPVAYTHSFDGLTAFAEHFEYVSGNGGAHGHHYDPYYRRLLEFVRRVDKRFGVWWEVERGTSERLVEFTDALHIATASGNDDIDAILDGGLPEGSVRSECRQILEMELLLHRPRAVLGNGRFASDLLWELCTGQPLRTAPPDAVIPKSRFGGPVHLSGFLTSKSMDGFSKARLVREIQAHGSFAER